VLITLKKKKKSKKHRAEKTQTKIFCFKYI
jgi:hypothetical protein